MLDTEQQIRRVMQAREEVVQHARFYGSLLFTHPIIAATNVRGTPIDTMATDHKNIYFNPAYVARLTMAETKGVLVHEVRHITDAHCLRINGRQHERWNRACDYTINADLIAEGWVLPAGALLRPDFAGLNAESIYEKLRREEEQQQPPPPPPSQGDDEGDEEEGEQSSPDQSEDENQPPRQDEGEPDDQGDGDEGAVKTPGENPEGSDDSGEGEPCDDGEAPADFTKPGALLEPVNDDGDALSPTEIDDARHEQQIENIQAAVEAERCGQLPGSAQRIIEEARTSRADWRETLRNFAAAHCITPVDSTWNRQNRRFIGAGQYLPGKRCEDPGDLVLVVDISGSINGYALGRFIPEIRRIHEDLQCRVRIITCDTRVWRDDTFEPGEEIKVVVDDGGGTNMAPAFALVDDMDRPPAGIVCFTDMEMWSWPTEPAVPVLWARWGGRGKPAPYGEMIDIDRD